MALDRQTVSIALTQGLDTKSDPKQVIPGKLVTLENGYFKRTGSILKRNGYTPLPTAIVGGSSVGAGRSISTFKSELFATTGATAYSLSANGWVSKGACEACEVSSFPLVRNGYQQTACDMSEVDTIRVVSWEDSSGGVRYSVFDIATGQPIVNNQLVSAVGVKPNVLTWGHYVGIFYAETTTNNIRCMAISSASPTTSTVFDVATNGNASRHFDGQYSGVTNNVYFGYQNDVGTISLRYVTNTLTVSAETVIAGSGVGAASNLSVAEDASGNVWCGFWDGTSVKVTAYDSTLNTVLLAPTVVETLASARQVAIGIQGTTCSVFYDVPATPAHNYTIREGDITLAGVVTPGALLFRSLSIVSEPFYVNGSWHLIAAYDSTLQRTYFVVTDTGLIVAKIASGVGGGTVTKASICEVELSAGVFEFPFLQTDRLTSVGGNVFTQTGVMLGRLDFNATPQQTLELSDNLLVSGGMLQMFDGAQVVEHGFHLFPENIVATPNAAGGSIAAGTYQYVVMWEWMDNFGQVHRSAPSVPVSITTTGATSSCVLTIPTLRLTAKTTPIAAVVYRTAANQVIFYRLTSITSPLLNDKTVDTISYSDTVADASIIGNEQLYTTGGEVENIAAPAPVITLSYRGRAIVVPGENRRTWWYSKQVIQGAPVEFNDAFVQAIDQIGGDITAAGVLDEKLILFKADHIFMVAGDGPSPSGQNNDFTQPYRIPTASGCIAKNSLALIPKGLMYQSSKGIYLLDRSLQVSYIGQAVEAYNTATIVSSEVIPDLHQVRFLLNTGVALAYDYFFDQWSTFTNISGVDATIFGGLYTYLQPGGLVMQETPGLFLDNGNPISMKLVTGWLSGAGLQGFERVRRLLVLGDYRSPHKLLVDIAHEYIPGPTQSTTVDVSTLLGTPLYGGTTPYGGDTTFGGEYPLYQFRVPLSRQKSQAIQITIRDAPTAPYGEAMSLSALAFEVGVKKGLNKKSATRTFSAP
jgi:hypothetical protein